MPASPEASLQDKTLLLQRFEPQPPEISTRLLIWFGIYLAGPLPLMVGGANGGLALWIFFPILLGNLVAVPLAMLPASLSDALAPGFLLVGWCLSYGVYVLHLIFTLRAHTRRRVS